MSEVVCYVWVFRCTVCGRVCVYTSVWMNCASACKVSVCEGVDGLENVRLLIFCCLIEVYVRIRDLMDYSKY